MMAPCGGYRTVCSTSKEIWVVSFTKVHSWLGPAGTQRSAAPEREGTNQWRLCMSFDANDIHHFI